MRGAQEMIILGVWEVLVCFNTVYVKSQPFFIFQRKTMSPKAFLLAFSQRLAAVTTSRLVSSVWIKKQKSIGAEKLEETKNLTYTYLILSYL